MYVNGFDGDPYAEVQHILEVLERGNPVKGITQDAAIIQIEQSDDKDVQTVIDELQQRGYTIVSKRRYANFTAVGIKKERAKTEKEGSTKITERQPGGVEPGDD